ncbi:zinc finger MYND domain-containing protein 11 isoform X1 [Armigeres subalbatus]|uniref:zinc finger MYND domain-containing protein 11 isoform X1 n=1 Tax=Armigeres subalbatus TaxID=124917 RepID=UPI002ED5C569
MEMERYHRKTPLKVLKFMWLAIRESNGQEIEHTRLVKHLQKIFTSAGDQIESYVTNAVVDNLIQVVDNPKRPKPKSVYHYTLPDVSGFSFADEHPDVYCYECHLEGNVQKCEDCVRVFHRECVKTLAEKHAKMEEYVTKYKRVNISDFGLPFVGSSTPVGTVASPPVDANENHTAPVAAQQEVRVKDELGIKQEEECKPDVQSDDPQFVRIVREADRRLGERLNTPTIKPEDNGGSGSNIMDSEDFIQKYCYPCRQIRGNLYNTPPNMSKQELNYLLKFVFEEYKSWLPHDTYSPTRLFNNRPRISEVVDNMDLCKKLLLRCPISMDTIQHKLEDSEYERLEEYSADILDIAHNIGIIHGSTSLEYNAVMYFVTDSVYDLFEIRQCSDCFRHSNEKAEPDWFARPCNTRHELVFAKHKGYQYWPAKVIRVVNNKYDVRFFGDKHSRAVVDAIFVKPIDTDLEVLKINPKKTGFSKSMEELHKHMALTSLPKDHYAYGNQPAGTIDVILRNAGIGSIVFTGTQISAPPVKKRGRRSRAQTRKTIDLLGDSASSASESFDQISLQSSSYSPATPNRETPNSPPRSVEKRTTRQAEKRSVEPTESSENSPVSSKSLRLEQDIVSLNGFSSSTVVSSVRSNDSISLGSGPSDESLKPRSPRIKAQLKRQYSEDVVKLKALMDRMDDIEKIKQLAADALQEDINRWQQKLRSLVKEYTSRLSEVKQKQWCKSCEHESILHCCWNTSYCSRDCQEKDWPTHKKLHKFSSKQQQH